MLCIIRGVASEITSCLHPPAQHGGDVVKFAGDALIILFAGSYAAAEEPKDTSSGSGLPYLTLLEGWVTKVC